MAALHSFLPWNAADHEAGAARCVTDKDVEPKHLLETRLRAAAAMRGMLAAVEAALTLAHHNWKSGAAFPTTNPGGHSVDVAERLRASFEAYAQAWGLAPRGEATVPKCDGIADRARALWAMSTARLAVTEGDAPAWLAVHRLLEFLLSEGPPSFADGPAPDPAQPPGHPANPVRARVLFESRNVGLVRDVFAAKYDVGPRSWFVDPVALGLTALAPDFVLSLRYAWRACVAATANTLPAIRLEPKLPSAKRVEGPSAGALAACAMFAAAVGDELNEDPSASVALRLKEGRSLDDGDPILLQDILVECVGGLESKLPEALAQNLRAVALAPGDVAQAQRGRWHVPASGEPLTLVACQNLAAVYQAITGNARVERVLRKHADQCVRDWDPTILCEVSDPRSPRRPEKPDPYVEPHLAQLALASDDPSPGAPRRGRKVAPLASDDDRRAVRAATEEALFAREVEAFLNMPSDAQTKGRVCLLEDANGGKTVFSKRLRGFLGTPAGRRLLGERPALVARFENTGAGFTNPWPRNQDELLLALRRLVEPFCAAESVSAVDVVAYALRRSRVVLILDALDQAGDCESLLQVLNDPHGPWLACPVIITGRTYKFTLDEHDSRFPGARYAFATISGFDQNQQARALAPYLARAGEHPWTVEALFEDYEQAAEQLAAPGMLKLAYDIAAEEHQAARRAGNTSPLVLRGLRTRADFYWRYYQGPLLRVAANKPTREGKALPTRDEPKWQMMMAVTAFRMILERATNYRIDRDRADAIRTDVANYCAALGKPITDNDWTNLHQFSVLTDHGTLEARDDGALGWRHKGWMEFFGAVFLAKFARPGALRAFRWIDIRPTVDDKAKWQPGFQGVDPDAFPPGASGDPQLFHAVLTQITNDEDWSWCWRFLAELRALPPECPFAFDAEASFASLLALFSQPARGLRPTKLMYGAWPLLEDMNARPERMALPRGTEPLPRGGEVLRAYQDQFTHILCGDDLGRARVAGQLVPESELRRLVVRGRLTEARQREILANPPTDGRGQPIPSYAVIPAGQGVTLGKGDETRTMDIPSFLMQTTAVTRAQYALFDSMYLAAQKGSFQAFKNQGDRCPAIFVDWFDAFCFSRWTGAELPSEWWWEYACQAGSQQEFCRIEDPSTTEGYRDLDNEWELKRVAYFNLKDLDSGPQQVARLLPNLWGLYDMHGNVSEWCFELVWGPRRVYRGGSWIGAAWYCRSPYSVRCLPDDRDLSLGFRLALVQSR